MSGGVDSTVAALLCAREREAVAVLGAAGSGKSALLALLCGMLEPAAGSLWANGRPLHAIAPEQRQSVFRRQFGVLPQDCRILPELTVAENVALPLRLAGVSRRAAEKDAAEWLGRLEVADIADKRPGEISGGQGQRVAVARALMHGPKVVFADEPTGALDSLNGERVMTLLVGAARESGAAVVVVTHEPRVAAYCDRELIVRDGRTGEAESAR